MRPGIFQGAFPIGLDLSECFQVAKSAGFEGVELSLESSEPLLSEAKSEATEVIIAIEKSVGLTDPRPGGLRLNSTKSDVEAIRKKATDTGLMVTSVSTMQLFYYPLSSSFPVVRERAIQIVRKMLEATAQLGGDVILVTPGMVTQDVPYQEVWRRSREMLSELVPHAEQLGVAIAIENVWNKFLLSPLEFRDYIDSFRSFFVGAYFDVANALRYGFPDQWIELLGHRLKRIHFKDYRLDIDDIRGFTYLMQGDVPWQRVMQALHKVGYDGWAIVEVPPYKVHPEQAIFDSATALRRLFELSF